MRVIAGDCGGIRGPAETVTPLNVWDVRLEGSATFELPPGHNAAVVVLEGEVSVEGSAPVGEAAMALLSTEGTSVSIAATKPAKILFLSGVPLGEPVVASGPFVMNTGAEIYQAIKDYQSGRMGHLS